MRKKNQFEKKRTAHFGLSSGGWNSRPKSPVMAVKLANADSTGVVGDFHKMNRIHHLH
jgi:hypothetical protein